MCLECIRKWREGQQEGEAAAKDHFDAQGLEDDDPLRALTSLQIACNVNPLLDHTLHQAW